jgi:hypothetical protein
VSNDTADTAANAAAADVAQIAVLFQPSRPTFDPEHLENEVVGDSPSGKNSVYRPSYASVEQSDSPGHCRCPVWRFYGFF